MRSPVQLLLDMFERPAPIAPPPAAEQPRPVPFTAPLPLPEAISPAVFSHPLANRQARLGHGVVGFHFRRARRRTIGFVVGPEGLVVSAPRWVPLAEVDAALREKSEWILRKLQESADRRRHLDSARIEWRDGALLPFLGEPLRLQFNELSPDAPKGAGAAIKTNREATAITLKKGVTAQRLVDSDGSEVLQLCLPPQPQTAQVRDAVQAWLMREARSLFTQRLDHFAPLLGVRWTRLSLSNAGTRWGSARADGAIRLNWRLIHCRLSIIDYVVAHELSHLRVMDHSPRFWETVGSVMPDYSDQRRALREQAVPEW
jgi:predicted metal-dependent hydrolase